MYSLVSQSVKVLKEKSINSVKVPQANWIIWIVCLCDWIRSVNLVKIVDFLAQNNSVWENRFRCSRISWGVVRTAKLTHFVFMLYLHLQCSKSRSSRWTLESLCCALHIFYATHYMFFMLYICIFILHICVFILHIISSCYTFISSCSTFISSGYTFMHSYCTLTFSCYKFTSSSCYIFASACYTFTSFYAAHLHLHTTICIFMLHITSSCIFMPHN